jgi:hypothetical protein
MGVIVSPPLLNSVSRLHALPHFGRRHSIVFVPQLPKRNCRHFDVQIDPIEERPTELAQVTLDHGRRTPAFSRGVNEKTAHAPVQVSTATEYVPRVSIRGIPKSFVFWPAEEEEWS